MQQPLVIAGPSGSGKSTLLKILFKNYPNSFGFSVSHTTRKPRPGEEDGREYYFIDLDQFEKDVQDGKFIEYATYGGNRYGTSFKAVEIISQANKICILDIDRRGVQSIKKTSLNPFYVFIKPPSVEILEKRLRDRGTESEDSLRKRMEEMKEEMIYAQQPNSYDVIIINDDLKTAYAELETFIRSKYPSIK